MTPITIEKKKYTYEDYLKISDDKRYELIDGELIMTPSPVPNHQRILKKLDFYLKNLYQKISLEKYSSRHVMYILTMKM